LLIQLFSFFLPPYSFLFLLLVAMYLAARLSLISERRDALEEERLEEKPVGPLPKPTMRISRLMVGMGLLLAIFGTFVIWADLLPAARILEKVELWSTMQSVTVTELDPSGVEQTISQEQLVAVTLADLLRALLIGLLTLALVRALPGVLEATVFRRLGPGERYAYVTIVKYAVVLGGLAVAFDAIGIGWSSIQWLVAAIGLGLGFGLQEIFANFISGLIILFERPIRIGDTVTVGDVSGQITRIRTRATTIPTTVAARAGTSPAERWTSTCATPEPRRARRPARTTPSSAKSGKSLAGGGEAGLAVLVAAATPATSSGIPASRSATCAQTRGSATGYPPKSTA